MHGLDTDAACVGLVEKRYNAALKFLRGLCICCSNTLKWNLALSRIQRLQERVIARHSEQQYEDCTSRYTRQNCGHAKELNKVGVSRAEKMRGKE